MQTIVKNRGDVYSQGTCQRGRTKPLHLDIIIVSAVRRAQSLFSKRKLISREIWQGFIQELTFKLDLKAFQSKEEKRYLKSEKEKYSSGQFEVQQGNKNTDMCPTLVACQKHCPKKEKSSTVLSKSYSNPTRQVLLLFLFPQVGKVSARIRKLSKDK